DLQPDLLFSIAPHVISESQIAHIIDSTITMASDASEFFGWKVIANQTANMIFNFPQKQKWFGKLLKLRTEICCSYDPGNSIVVTSYQDVLVLNDTRCRLEQRRVCPLRLKFRLQAPVGPRLSDRPCNRMPNPPFCLSRERYPQAGRNAGL